MSGTIDLPNLNSQTGLYQIGKVHSHPTYEEIEELTTELLHLRTEILRIKSFYRPMDNFMELMNSRKQDDFLEIITQYVYSQKPGRNLLELLRENFATNKDFADMRLMIIQNKEAVLKQAKQDHDDLTRHIKSLVEKTLYLDENLIMKEDKIKELSQEVEKKADKRVLAAIRTDL